MNSVSRFESMPNSRLLHLLLAIAKSKCPYIETKELISVISNHEKYRTMRYTRSFMKQTGAEVKPYNLDRNLLLDITSIYPRESNKHFIVAAMCVYMMLYVNLTEQETPDQNKNVQREISQEIRSIISTSFYVNEPVSLYLRYTYEVAFEDVKCEDIAQFAYSLSDKLISQQLLLADQKVKLIDIFEHSLKRKLPALSSISIEKADFSYFEQEERQFVSFLVTTVVLPILTDNRPESIQIALDLMRGNLIEHSDIVTEAVEYDKIFH